MTVPIEPASLDPDSAATARWSVEALENFRATVGEHLVSLDVDDHGLDLAVMPSGLRIACLALRDRPELGMTYPADLCGADTGDRIRVWYRVWNPIRRFTARVVVETPSSNPRLPSVSDIWPGFDWYERECYDMFGVYFDGHPRSHDPAAMRILLPEDWDGHPFRKDYAPVFTDDPLHGPQRTN